MADLKNLGFFREGRRPLFPGDGEGEKKARPGEVETLVGLHVAVEGELIGNGTMSILGKVSGVVRTDGHVEIGETARVRAGIEAASARIAGEVKGTVKVKGKLELLATARLVGDIEAQALVVADGAVFQGKCVMIREETKEIKEKKARPNGLSRPEKATKHIGEGSVPRSA